MSGDVGERVVFDREFTEEELRSSPFVGLFDGAVVVGPDEYRWVPGLVDGDGGVR